MPAPYPQELREDVVRVARSREDGVTLAQIAKDFGIHEMTLHKWIRQADIDDGNRPGRTRGPPPNPPVGAGERGPAPRGRLPLPGKLAGKRLYPLVSELVADGIPVAVSLRVLELSRQPYYRWRKQTGHHQRAGRGLPGQRPVHRAYGGSRVRPPAFCR